MFCALTDGRSVVRAGGLGVPDCLDLVCSTTPFAGTLFPRRSKIVPFFDPLSLREVCAFSNLAMDWCFCPHYFSFYQFGLLFYSVQIGPPPLPGVGHVMLFEPLIVVLVNIQSFSK